MWRTGDGPGGDLPSVLDRLHALAEPLTCLAAAGPADRAAGEEQELPAGLLEAHPAVRALGRLLDYAAARATKHGGMPSRPPRGCTTGPAPASTRCCWPCASTPPAPSPSAWSTRC
ncbi:hypothetical protein AB0M32_09525 [Streptomyces sp. NPDC051985]|uniref:hypothetical protein n=1 Tax=Streptomyces sp. NPDC051985 TaxID=3155807 RepID=UPI00342E066A